MSTNAPRVSVIIPAYNQAQFLAGAIHSVLAQTYRDFEIIVVDDGSTDETPFIARQFGSAICYVRQGNRGLAGARNTGIRRARGEYVALLDSDDQWMPSFLQTMMSVVAQNPGAAVYYCGCQYMDAVGRDLPQPPSTWVIPPDAMYRTLLRANFIIPSTVVMRRSAIAEVGLFDEVFRRVEDWELWIRLLRGGHAFIGSTACLVRYRLHGSSLSDNATKMQQAVLAVVEKHFGPNDDEWGTWPEEKRWAYGGAHRYHALTSVLRQNDWQMCAAHLRKALQFDPTQASDLDLFYELALGTQRPGYRGVFEYLDFERSAQNLLESLGTVFGTNSLPSELKARSSEAYGHAYLALGLLAYGCRRMRETRRYLLRAICFHPPLMGNPQVLPKLLKSLLGARLLDTLRRWRIGWACRSR